MNERFRKLAQQAGAEFYKGFAGSPNTIRFQEDQFQRFAHAIEQLIEAEAVAAYDRGYDEGYNVGESQATFAPRLAE